MGLNWQNTIYNDRVLTGSPRYLMITLADKCHDSTNTLEIGFDKLAWLMNLKSAKQIKRLLDYLKSENYIDYVSGDGRGKLSKITFKFAQKKVDISERPTQKKVDILDENEEIKVDIFEQAENKGGHFETEKVDILEQKGGHSPARANKDLLPPFTTVDITTEEEERAPVREQINSKQTGIAVNSTFSPFVQTCLAGMNIRLNAPHTLPKQFDWLKRFELWELNESTPENFLETYDLLEKIRKKKKAAWTVTFETVEKNFGKIESLRNEVAQLEEETHGSSNTKTNGFKSERERREEQKLLEAQYFAEIERGAFESE